MIELFNNIAKTNDANIIDYLSTKTTQLRYSKFQIENHFINFHKKPELISLVNNNHSTLWDISEIYPWCSVCNTMYQSLISGNEFPIGFIDILTPELSTNIIDKRIRPTSSPLNINLNLYDYQQEIVNNIIKKGRGIIKVPTGGGKTEIAIAITAKLGLKTTIVVPTMVIQKQFIDRFNKYGLSVSQFGGGSDKSSLITIGVVNSITGDKELSKKLLSDTQVLILDEHHRYGATSWFQVLTTCPAYYRIGQSATPWRTDELGTLKLIGLTGERIGEITVNELQDEGKLSEAYVFMYKIGKDSYDVNPRSDSWVNIRDKYIFNYTPRTNAIVYLANEYAKAGNKVLILCGWDNYAQILLPLLDEPIYLKGGISSKKIKETIGTFSGGAIMVATTVADEGMDIPDVNILINAAGGKDIKRTQQRAGRALRFSPNKDYAIIIDFIDNHVGFLQFHSSMRKTAYEKLGLPVKVIE